MLCVGCDCFTFFLVVSGQTNNISPGAIATAQSVNNSCNGVLKAVAQALLKNAGV